MVLEQRIVVALKRNGPMSAQMLAGHVEASFDNLRNTLSEMKRAGILQICTWQQTGGHPRPVYQVADLPQADMPHPVDALASKVKLKTRRARVDHVPKSAAVDFLLIPPSGFASQLKQVIATSKKQKQSNLL